MWSYILMISLLSEIGRLDFFNIKLWFFVCSGLILSSSQTPIHPLAQSPAEWGGKRRKIRVMDLNDYNLINKAERWIHSLLPVCGQLSDHFLKNTTSIGVTGALEDNTITTSTLSFPPLPTNLMVWGQLWSAVPTASPPDLLPTPSRVSSEWKRKSLDTVPALISNNQNTAMLSSLF